jgi:hypothetical protein
LSYKKENLKKYRHRYKEYDKTYQIKYRQKHKKQYKSKKRYYKTKSYKDYIKNKKQNNLLFKISCNIRSRLSNLFKNNKLKTTEKILGCSRLQLIEHLQKQYLPGMNDNNYGKYGWHIDHIIPLSSAKNLKDLIKLCHYTNLQPLWAKDNLKKSNKILNKGVPHE